MLPDERQSRCHGLSTFVAELVVFGIGKVEISQYLSHALPGLLLPDRERKSRNITILSRCHGFTKRRKEHIKGLSFFIAGEKVEIHLPYADERQSRCHGLSTFLAELVAFGTGKVEILQYYLMRAELVAFDIGKVEILQYYGGRAGQYIATAFGFPLFLAELVVSGIEKVEKLQYYLIPGPCHGLSTFLAELVVFDIGKVEISQYYLTRLRTEKSKYYKYNPRHAGPL
jgi:hypothetical protein